MKETSTLLGLHPRTIQKMDKARKIRATRTPGGRRRIPESEIKRLGLREDEGKEEKKKRHIVGYVRVSSSTQKDDLQRQKQLLLLTNHANKERSHDGAEIQVLTDIGSGLSEKRKNFLKLLHMVLERRVSKVLTTYQDRLTMFGFTTLQKLFSAFGT